MRTYTGVTGAAGGGGDALEQARDQEDDQRIFLADAGYGTSDGDFTTLDLVGLL